MRLGAKASLKRTKAESATTANPAKIIHFEFCISPPKGGRVLLE